MKQNNNDYQFNTGCGEGFNQYSLTYVSPVPVHGEIFYRVNNSGYREDFFLEAGHRTFRSFIDGYLSGTTGSGDCKISLSGITSELTDFELLDFSVAQCEVPAQIIYIENGRFKIGSDLSWGGGLCYIEDPCYMDAEIKNLLNRCDAGRLVQQSYYGTMEAPYECAQYGGAKWSYNPVQGGDQHGNKSKIIDFAVSADRIYIKCRPMDWAQNNRITPSYMENTYILNEDYIRVDNRFVDFSNYIPRMSHQELPAFYVISYLDHFTLYEGTKPWSGDALTVKKDLKFWGDHRYSKDCYHQVRKGNTETWCAWTSGETGFGIGLYTPNVEILFAGRHAYNGSKDPTDGATNYVAPICSLALRSFEPFEYSYLMTTGDIDKIRTTFTRNKDFKDNALVSKFHN